MRKVYETNTKLKHEVQYPRTEALSFGDIVILVRLRNGPLDSCLGHHAVGNMESAASGSLSPLPLSPRKAHLKFIAEQATAALDPSATTSSFLLRSGALTWPGIWRRPGVAGLLPHGHTQAGQMLDGGVSKHGPGQLLRGVRNRFERRTARLGK